MQYLGYCVIIILILLGIYWVVKNVRFRNEEDFKSDREQE